MGGILNYIAAARIERGRVRLTNEDIVFNNGRLLPQDSVLPACGDTRFRKGVFAIFDGMGGEALGDYASLAAASILPSYYNPILYSENRHKQVEQYLKTANTILRDKCRELDISMGTTMAMLCLDGETVQVFNAGDSRVYLLRDGELIMLTRDHTTVQELASTGAINPSNAVKSNINNALTLYLGKPSENDRITPNASGPFQLFPGDRFLVCSDGITGMLDNTTIARELSANRSAGDIVDKLTSLALKNGGNDNISAIVIKEFTDFDMEHYRMYGSFIPLHSSAYQRVSGDTAFVEEIETPPRKSFWNKIFFRATRLLPDAALTLIFSAGVWLLYEMVNTSIEIFKSTI